MSRIGKQPINLPDKVEVKIDGSVIRVKGPLGELSWELPHLIEVEQKEKQLLIKLKRANASSLHGTARARIANLVTGVDKGFTRNLEIHGLGFKAALQGQKVVLSLGFSHPVEYALPSGIKLEIDKKATKIVVSGADKEVVGRVAAQLRSLRKPEPYKGKGIRYAGERIIRKAGKTAAGAGGVKK
ncbi:MAG: 50S ribosomal protein L6 [Elusimicrobiota bacterium]